MQKHCEEKKKVEEAYSRFSTLLQESKETLQKIPNTDSNFNSIRSQYLSLFESKIQESRELLENALKYQEWDNLVIAFFGITNAGKSTIIETFRILFDEETRKAALKKSNGKGVDGVIVGDGKMDFTKTYDEYKMSINGQRFILIDVPGIEGNESEVKEEILKALGKAHCVFCVHGMDKKPDSKVIEKIKTYLKDWVKVYSILNVKGTSFNYDEDDERLEFKTKTVLSLEKQTQEVFSNALGKNYAGNITTQALLALCAKAQFSPKRADLKKEQKLLLESFKNPDAILDFCEFDSVVDVVKELSVHYSEEICEAHKTKVLGMYKTTYQSLKRLNTTQKAAINQMIGKLDRLKEFINNEFNSTESSIQNQIRKRIKDGFDNLKKDGCDAIDAGYSGEELETFLDEKKDVIFFDVNDGIKDIIQNEAFDLNTSIQDAIDQIKKEMTTTSNLNDIADMDGVEVLFEDVIDKLKFGFSDAMNWAFFLGGSFMFGWTIVGTNWWNPVGWGLAALLAGIAIFGGDKESKAKSKLSEKIDEAQKQCLETSYKEICNNVNTQFDKQKNKICSNLKKDVKSLKSFVEEIDDLMVTINKYNHKLNNTNYGKL